jgi:hypothetical protein
MTMREFAHLAVRDALRRALDDILRHGAEETPTAPCGPGFHAFEEAVRAQLERFASEPASGVRLH